MRYGVQILAGALVGVVLGLGSAGPGAADTTANTRTEAGAFLAGTEDLPLMAGLRQVAERGVVFETAQGRIVEVYAVGYLTAERVSAFYRQTLPQLGWRRIAGGPDLRFHREGEILTLSFPSRAEPLTVRFRIVPGG
ncbi:hypothetical protein [Roseospira goensis]|uniref:Uncharacterized protein n=1 Tax=Roseospira goensis TaxID=391922 RepID=A0A7W6RZC3_9PROT|nr:hypothetical protein [Roseospira goensis]MBB4286024.1 hypothetical protein [Roseospira goensis]